jgi:hypothetical protein
MHTKSFPWIIACLFAAFATSAPVSSFAQKPAEKWYEIDPGQKVVAEFHLKPGESKNVEVITKEPRYVGFTTDMSFEEQQKHRYPAPGVKLSRNLTFVSSPKGSATYWSVKGGKIALKVENLTKLPLRIVVYEGPKPVDWNNEPMD